MTKWADGKIDTEEATARMNEANGWRITPEQFVEAAQSLGYRRFAKWNNTYERWMTDWKALEDGEVRMRLIDGAELFRQICRTHDEFIGLDELAELMDKMPTINAIPLEWIKEFVNERAANDGPDGWWLLG